MKRDRLREVYLSSAPLVRIGSDSLPTGYASACIADYRGKRILLTVSHATGDQADWALQIRYKPGCGTQLHRLGGMNFLARGDLYSSDLEDVDFSYVELPDGVTPYRQDVEAGTNKVKDEWPISIHALTFLDSPNCSGDYGFCGMVNVHREEHFGKTYFSGDIRAYDGLKFIREEDDYYVFKLPFKHPGHEYFKGCSGAPIINGEGVPVALVCEGREDGDEIWGISLSRYKTVIDITLYASDV